MSFEFDICVVRHERVNNFVGGHQNNQYNNIGFYRHMFVVSEIVQGSTLTFEGACQVGPVNFNLYLPNKILNCLAKGVI